MWSALVASSFFKFRMKVHFFFTFHNFLVSTCRFTHSRCRRGRFLGYIYGIFLGYIEDLLEVLPCEFVRIVDEEPATYRF
jgi:hypothetical protein